MKSRNQWQINEVTGGGEIKCLCQVPVHGSLDSNKCPLVSTVVHIVIAVQNVQKVLDVASRREFLKSNRLCLNYTRLGMPLPSADLEDVESETADITCNCNRLSKTLPGNNASTSLGPCDRFYGANDCQMTLHSTVEVKVNGV